MGRVAWFLLIAFALISCGRGKVRTDGYSTVPRSTGAVMEIVAVVDSGFYSEQVKEALFRHLSPVMTGLPQKERRAKLYIIPRSSFSRTYQTMRNLVLIERSDSLTGVTTSKDIYAAPQIVFSIKASNAAQAEKQIDESGNYMFNAIRKNAIETLQERFSRITNKKLKAIPAMGINICIPNYYHVVRSEKDFMWLTMDITKNGVKGSANILLYRTDSSHNNKNAVALRDSMTKKYVPGQAEGSYMAVEKTAVLPQQESVVLSGIPATFTYGYWRTEGDFMGGPFINYTIVDKEGQTAYSADGFVYLPFEEKGGYALELEAILRTFHIPALSQKEEKK